MDTFGYSLLPAAARAGLDTTTVSRHLPLFRRAVNRDEVTLAVAYARGGLLVLLTDAHLVITHQTRPLHRIRFHLHAGLDELRPVDWATDPARHALALHLRLRDREHRYLLRPGYPADPDRLATAFRHAFDPAAGAPARPTPAPPRRAEAPTLATFLTVQPPTPTPRRLTH